jgi:hypothetical protein
VGFVSVKETWVGRRAGLPPGARRYTRTVRVITDDPTMTPLQVAAAPGMPGWFTPYIVYDLNGNVQAYDFGVFVNDISPVQDSNDPYVWLVSVEYGSAVMPGGMAPNNSMAKSGGDPLQSPNVLPDPTTRPPIIRWTMSPHQKPLFSDADGTVLTNTAGMSFANRPMIDDSRLSLTWTRNEATFDPETAYAFVDTTNAEDFLFAKRACAKISDISAQAIFENGIYYNEVTYRIDFRARQFIDGTLIRRDGTAVTSPIPGWEMAIQNVGRYQLVANVKKRILVAGQPTQVDVPLGADGQVLADAAAAAGNLIHIVFKPYPETHWAQLHIP